MPKHLRRLVVQGNRVLSFIHPTMMLCTSVVRLTARAARCLVVAGLGSMTSKNFQTDMTQSLKKHTHRSSCWQNGIRGVSGALGPRLDAWAGTVG